MSLRHHLVDTTPLRISRDFRWLYIGRTGLLLGAMLTETALIWQIYRISGSYLAVGAAAAAGGIGIVVGLLVGGVLADRFDRRRILLAVRVPGLLVALALLMNALQDEPLLWFLFVAVVLDTFLAGLSIPASFAAVPSLVGQENVAAASALNGLAGQLTSVAGPALAGLVIAAGGTAWCYGLNVLGFAVFAVAMLFVGPMPPDQGDAEPGETHSLKDAFAFVRRNKVVAGVLLIDIMPMLFAMPKGLFPALATEQFHGGSVAFGLLSSAAGVGAFLAAALSGRVTKTARPGVVVIVAAGTWGAAMAGLALSPWLWLGLAFLALSGASDLVSEVLRTGLLQNHTPDRLRGRVTSLWLAQATVSPALGNLQAGALAGPLGLAGAILAGGIACVAGVAVVGWRLPAFRRAKMEAQRAPEAAAV
ncbi:MFS transporter [Glycomyces sp. TRM65418]|uniref:MFS transporter n=1 Tax=Glycomyces sp. TRM65418 TaxID=2867006 RepID=UPI001CE57390|nr:MFS transporter [Glycomyces sp. TRM65418]MCC3765432.1 MFS transporter [Glycomyces sp. TRM65418]QZD55042.1 MFS transporter [Glycomyces sp. TRM65418]